MSISVCQRLKGIPGNTICPLCNTACADNEKLLKHLWTHQGCEPNPFSIGFSCPWPSCVARLKHISALKDHIKIHTGERDNVCPHLINSLPGKRILCAKTYPSFKSLIRHRQVAHKYHPTKHTAEDPYVDAESPLALECAPLLGLGDKVDKKSSPSPESEDGTRSEDSASEPSSESGEENEVKEQWAALIKNVCPFGIWPSQQTPQQVPQCEVAGDDTQTQVAQGNLPLQHDFHPVDSRNQYNHTMSPLVNPLACDSPGDLLPQSNYYNMRPLDDWYGYGNGYTSTVGSSYDPFGAVGNDGTLYHNYRAATYNPYPAPYSPNLPYYDTGMMGLGNMYGTPGFDFGSRSLFDYSGMSMGQSFAPPSRNQQDDGANHIPQGYGLSDTD